MQLYVSVLLLALAVSLDSFGAGLNYGLRNIKIPIGSILIIALCSGGIGKAACLREKWKDKSSI